MSEIKKLQEEYNNEKRKYLFDNIAIEDNVFKKVFKSNELHDNIFEFKSYFQLSMSANDIKKLSNFNVINLYNEIIDDKSEYIISYNTLNIMLFNAFFVLITTDFEEGNDLFEKYFNILRVVLLKKYLELPKDSIKIRPEYFKKMFFDNVEGEYFKNDLFLEYQNLTLNGFSLTMLIASLFDEAHDYLGFISLMEKLENKEDYKQEEVIYYINKLINILEIKSYKILNNKSILKGFLIKLYFDFLLNLNSHLNIIQQKYCKDIFSFEITTLIKSKLHYLIFNSRIKNVVSDYLLEQELLIKKVEFLNKTTYIKSNFAESEKGDLYFNSRKIDEIDLAKNKILNILDLKNVFDLKDDSLNCNLINNFETIKNNINNKIYGMENIKKFIFRNINIAKYNKNGFKINTTLLHGSPGIGKSYLLKVVAEELGLPYLYVSLNGKNSWELIGQQKSWRGAEEGLIAKFLKSNNYPKNAIIILDEIDKVQSNNTYENYYAALSKVLDENLNHEFEDNYSLEKYDLSGITFFLTANDLKVDGQGFEKNVLPDYLLNRISLLNVNDYKDYEKLEIINNFVLNKVTHNYNFNKEFKLCEDSIKYVIKQANEKGLRQAEKIIRHIYEEYIYQTDLDKEFKLDFNFVKSLVDEITDTNMNFKVGFN